MGEFSLRWSSCPTLPYLGHSKNHWLIEFEKNSEDAIGGWLFLFALLGYARQYLVLPYDQLHLSLVILFSAVSLCIGFARDASTPQQLTNDDL